jgi:glycosyltransferase involved in cell wall biosynthesis
MKVVFCLTRSDTIGGAQQHVLHMCCWLTARGIETAVVVGGDGVFCEALRKHDIPFIVATRLRREINVAGDIAGIFELRRIFKAAAPDIISMHSTKAGLLGRLAAVGLRSKVLFTAHGWAFTEGIPSRRAWVYKIVERVVAPLADRIITVSRFDRSIALRNGVGRDNQLVTIHNAMPDVEGRANPGDTIGPVLMACVARLDEQKDHASLFQALARIEIQNWRVNLVGDGPLLESLMALATHLGIAGKINFLGFQRDVESLLCASQLFVLSTNWEGLPRSIIEAMRAGLPVVASDVGGVSELVEDDINGFIVARKDVTALAGRLQKLIDDPALRMRMGASARAKYEQDFEFERMAAENLNLYREVIEISHK